MAPRANPEPLPGGLCGEITLADDADRPLDDLFSALQEPITARSSVTTAEPGAPRAASLSSSHLPEFP